MNTKTKNIAYFIIPSLIWGSTWFAIKFQLGMVDPLLSVSYRFALAGILLLLILIVLKFKLRFSLTDHFFMALQGICLFGVNYWLVYLAENYLASGLIAVIFSLILFTNMIFSALILKTIITRRVLIGAFLGVGGTFLIFKNELLNLNQNKNISQALMLALISVVLASLGNVISGYNQRRKLPVVQVNAYGMLYGALTVFIIALFRRTEINFDTRLSYLVSLGYLSLFGSIIAFSAYLSLLGRIGPSRAAYVIVFIPILAMVISTIFESYVWQKSALIGMPVILSGNIIAMSKISIKKFKNGSRKISE